MSMDCKSGVFSYPRISKQNGLERHMPSKILYVARFSPEED